MTVKNNAKKSEQLGMSYGKANNILRKNIIFELSKRCGMRDCYQCGKSIDDIDNFSIEHIEPWLDSKDAVELYFSMDNIAFSHTKCNVGARRKPKVHHTQKDPLSYARSQIGRSGFKGVSLVNKGKYKYQSYIRAGGKNVHIKYGNDPVELAKLYDEKAVELIGENAITNKKLGLL